MTRNGPRWRPFLLAWILLSALSTIWALATPIGAAPDEPAHMVKAASVVRGQLAEPTTEYGSIVQVPYYVAFTQAGTCYAFQSEITADCGPEPSGDPAELVDAYTTAGLYNPVYYALVGWPTLIFQGEAGLYAMRIVSALISSLFLAFAFFQIVDLRRRTIPLLAFAVAVTPMVLFLNSSVNPNSLEATAVLATFVTMLCVFRTPDRHRLASRAAIVAVSASLAVTTRGISPLWVALALFIPFIIAHKDDLTSAARAWSVRIAAGVILLATAFALFWTLSTNSLGAGLDNIDGALAAPGIGTSPIAGFLMILFGTLNYAQGLIGVFGWLDTPSPPTVFFVWSAFIGTLLLLGTTIPKGRPRAMVVVLFALVVFLPPIIQGAYITRGGLIWQGRYLLPLFLCLVVALGLVLSDALPELEIRVTRPVSIIVLGAWAVSHLYGFVTALRRYAVGLNGELDDMVVDPAWAPPGEIVPLTIAFALVIGVSAFILGRTALRPPHDGELSVYTEPITLPTQPIEKPSQTPA